MSSHCALRAALLFCAGLYSLLITLTTAGAVHYYKPYGLDLTWIADHHVQLCTSAIAFSCLLSVYLYVSSFKPGALLATGGNSRIALYDFFIGRELNPRVLGGKLDLKYFCELRPGMFMWFLINAAAAARQQALHGAVDASMWLVLIFEGYYILDSVMNEKAILSTMDITMDGFGFMLAFGDLVWVPFMYSLQARYLSDFPQNPSWSWIAVIVGVGATGMYIFRGANSQKDTFRTNPADPAVAHLHTLQTAAGTKLITSGWWGLARHINYFGDWLMSVAWCLPCGFATPLVFFYPAYFAVLLIHRELRDEHKCAHKYGKDWDTYCSLVKYRIIPGIY